MDPSLVQLHKHAGALASQWRKRDAVQGAKRKQKLVDKAAGKFHQTHGELMAKLGLGLVPEPRSPETVRKCLVDSQKKVDNYRSIVTPESHQSRKNWQTKYERDHRGLQEELQLAEDMKLFGEADQPPSLPPLLNPNPPPGLADPSIWTTGPTSLTLTQLASIQQTVYNHRPGSSTLVSGRQPLESNNFPNLTAEAGPASEFAPPLESATAPGSFAQIFQQDMYERPLEGTGLDTYRPPQDSAGLSLFNKEASPVLDYGQPFMLERWLTQPARQSPYISRPGCTIPTPDNQPKEFPDPQMATLEANDPAHPPQPMVSYDSSCMSTAEAGSFTQPPAPITNAMPDHEGMSFVVDNWPDMAPNLFEEVAEQNINATTDGSWDELLNDLSAIAGPSLASTQSGHSTQPNQPTCASLNGTTSHATQP